MDWKLELLVVPVSDVDRAKSFYIEQAGFGLDVDYRAGEVSRRAADSAGLGVLDRTHAIEYRGRDPPGPAPGRLGHRRGARRTPRSGDGRQRDLPFRVGESGARGLIPNGTTTGRSSPSATPTATAG